MFDSSLACLPDCAFGFPGRSAGWLAPETGEVSRFSRAQFLDVRMALGLRRA
jgi:hypothetical protein